MKCPSCSAAVAEDAVVCPNCDYVLDPSLFDSAPPRIEDEPTGRKAVPTSRPGPKRPLKKKPGARMPDAPPPSKGAGGSRDWRSKVSAEDWGPAPVAKPSESDLPSSDPEDAMEDVKRFLFELGTADKLALFGAVAMLLACFFPWKETVREGAVLGLMSLGVVVFVGGIVAISAIAVRVRKVFGTLNPVVPWVIQLAAVAGSILWCLIYIRASWDPTLARAPVGNYEMAVSKPSIGVFLAFLGGCVSGLGTFFGLKGSR